MLDLFPVELIKGHDNSPKGFAKLAYVQLPAWLAKKLFNLKKAESEHSFFQVVEETEKAYKILGVRDASLSYDFVRPTWYITYVAKSVVVAYRTDIEACEKEEADWWLKKLNK